MSIFDKYDLVDVDESITIPDMPTGKTLVIGSSGSGKTTILNAWGLSAKEYNQNIPIISLFESEEIGEKLLISAGLRSIPTWRRPLSQLSNGEQHRAEMALMLADNEMFFDEFTSVVDRATARALCESMNKSKLDRFVVATCHRDVSQWLDVENIYDTDLRGWVDRRCLRRDKTIRLKIEPVIGAEVWPVFKKHHYLSGSLNKSASCWVGSVNGGTVAFSSILAFPNGNFKNGWREHRTVVLPEWQGLGIGSAMSDSIAQHVLDVGGRFFSKTSHPSFGQHRENSAKWKPTSKNRKIRRDYSIENKTKEDGHKMGHAARLCFSHEYVGVQ